MAFEAKTEEYGAPTEDETEADGRREGEAAGGGENAEDEDGVAALVEGLWPEMVDEVVAVEF